MLAHYFQFFLFDLDLTSVHVISKANSFCLSHSHFIELGYSFQKCVNEFYFVPYFNDYRVRRINLPRASFRNLVPLVAAQPSKSG